MSSDSPLTQDDSAAKQFGGTRVQPARPETGMNSAPAAARDGTPRPHSAGLVCPLCAQAGRGAPYGWRFVEGELVADRGEQLVIAAVREYRTAGLSLRDIALRLADRGMLRSRP